MGQEGVSEWDRRVCPLHIEPIGGGADVGGIIPNCTVGKIIPIFQDDRLHNAPVFISMVRFSSCLYMAKLGHNNDVNS